MSSCVVCEHVKVEAIEADLRMDRDRALMAVWYHVRKRDLSMHAGHMDVSKLATQPLAPKTMRDELITDSSLCLCYWCGMSGYQRLLRAWEEANTQEKERFCVDTRTMDVPF